MAWSEFRLNSWSDFDEAEIDKVFVVEASIDGVPLQGLRRYRAESPAYTQVLPEGTVRVIQGTAEAPAGTMKVFWKICSQA